MTFNYADATATFTAGAPDDLYEETEAAPAETTRQATVKRLVASFFVATMLIALVAAGVYLASTGSESAPAVAAPSPTIAPPTVEAFTVPSFAEFAGETIEIGFLDHAQPAATPAQFAEFVGFMVNDEILTCAEVAIPEVWKSLPEADQTMITRVCGGAK